MFFFFSSRRRHTSWTGDWSSDVCSSDLGGIVGPFGGFHVAPENRELIAILLELEQPCALSRHRIHEIRLTLTALARGARDSCHDFPHFGVEFPAQAPVLGELSLILWIVAAVLHGQFLQPCFSLQEIRLQLLNKLVVENIRQSIQGPAAFEKFARLLLPGIPLKRLFLRFHHLF